MFKDKEMVKAIAALAFGIVLSIFGFLAGLISAFKGEWIACGIFVVLVCGTGIFLTVSAYASDDLP